VAGLVGSWAANQFHSLWSYLAGEEQNPDVARLSDRGGRPDTAAAKENVASGMVGRRGSGASDSQTDPAALALPPFECTLQSDFSSGLRNSDGTIERGLAIVSMNNKSRYANERRNSTASGSKAGPFLRFAIPQILDSAF